MEGYLSLIVAAIGLVIYIISSNPKAAELWAAHVRGGHLGVSDPERRAFRRVVTVGECAEGS